MVKEIKNKALKNDLMRIDPTLEHLMLMKDSDNGYFYLSSDDEEGDVWGDRISSLYYNHILVNSFKDLTIEEWVSEILDVLLQDTHGGWGVGHGEDLQDWQLELMDRAYGMDRPMGDELY